MAALLLVVPVLILGGCDLTGVMSPEEKGEAIAFEASSPLLHDDATNTKAIKEAFGTGDAFAVFGWHNQASDNIIFNGTAVTKQAGGSWSYSPAKQWEWDGSGDYYDFVAVYPYYSNPTRMAIPGNLTVATSYNLSAATPDEFDLLCATLRRKGIEDNLKATVNLQFSHMLSAVSVVIENDSDETAFTLTSYCFQHLVVSGSCRVTLDDDGNPDYVWVDTERNANLVRETSPASTSLSPDDTYPGDFDLMIPGALDVASDGSDDPDKMPTLILNLRYTPTGGVQQTSSIFLSLKDIEDADGTPITSWERGIKYTYYIAVRLDGGVRVKVVTTQWETIEAETPGILI